MVRVLLLLSLFVIPCAAQTSSPNILILYPFRTAAMPYAAAAESFKTALSREIGTPLNIFEYSLDLDRFPSLQMQSELAAFLKKRFEGNRLDLIVPIGAPAANFTLRYADSAFPGTPILFLSADPRLVDLESVPRNATTVNQISKTSDWIEDILQMAPDTTNIAVVLGASPTEETWKEIILRECQAFKGRVNLTFFNGMSLDEIEKRVSAMPPHSFILLAMLMRDGAGITFDGYTSARTPSCSRQCTYIRCSRKPHGPRYCRRKTAPGPNHGNPRGPQCHANPEGRAGGKHSRSNSAQPQAGL